MSDQNKLAEFRPMEPNVAYIGEAVSIKGEMSVPDVIVVDGTFEGELTARSIRIGPSGVIRGNIIATDADVHGSISEKLEIKQLMILRSTARVQGNVSYGELQIEKGAMISGEFSSTDFRSERKQGVKPELAAAPVKLDRLKLTVGGAESHRPSGAETGRLPPAANVANSQGGTNVSTMPVVDLADVKVSS